MIHQVVFYLKLQMKPQIEMNLNHQQKKTKMAQLFSFMEVTELQTSCDIEEEYQAYLNYQILEVTEISKNPLTFWKKNSSIFPQLARVVRKYFAIPATSASVDRVFNQAGKILHQDRSHLLPKNFANLGFFES